MKALSLTLAAVSGASFLFHNQIQTLVSRAMPGLPGSARSHEAPAGVYYMRAAYSFAAPGGAVRWSAGQELRAAQDTLATNGMMTLTDGRNNALVPESAITRDMDEAVALRQPETPVKDNAIPRTVTLPPPAETVAQPNPDRLVAGRFHETSLDAPAVHTNCPENIVATAGGSTFYSTYNTTTVVVGQPARAMIRPEIVAPMHPIQPAPRPRSTLPPVTRSY